MSANLAAIIDFHSARRPEHIAIADEARSLTYRELADRSHQTAAALRALGVERGDVVALLMYNRVEFIECVFAVARLGAVFLPMNYRLAPAEWTYILENSTAKALISEREFADAVNEIRPDLPLLQHVVSVDDAPTSWLEFESLLADHRDAHVASASGDDDALQRIMYTSGTTARPKGVCLTHSNIAYKNAALIVEFGWAADEVTLVAGPLYHVGALDMGGLATLAAGGRIVLRRRFDPSLVLQAIADHRATSVWLAPAMVNALLQSPDLGRTDLTSLGLILSGGEKMPVARLHQILEAIPGLWFADAYGLTETASSDTFLDHAHMREKIGSVGRPVLYQELRVVTDDMRDVPVGALGEIVVRGPKVFREYWRDPAATAAAFSDDWFHTGDIGRLDAEGYLYIEDRKKDMIVSGGENIATPEVERVLYEHHDVVEAAVIGRAHERWGEVPHAVVVLRGDATVTADELIAFCSERLAKYKVPRTVTLVGELPRTPSGKVLKKDLRARLEMGVLR